MRRLIFLAVLGAALIPAAARAQLSVYVKMERDVFVLYEPIPVVVSIQNYTGRDIELTNQGESSWLDFAVSDEHSQLVNAVGKPRTDEPLVVPAGRTVARQIDLVPSYDLRAHGVFQVQARVANGPTQTLSAPLKFSIIRGQELWHQTVGVRGEDKSKDEFRTYLLQARRDNESTILYLCVRDDEHQLVYGMLQLGVMIALGEPEARVDGVGHAHVLYCAGPHAFGYLQIDPQAKVVDRRVYSDIASKPRLVSDTDGHVVVRGGEQTFPRKQRQSKEPEATESVSTNAPPATVMPLDGH